MTKIEQEIERIKSECKWRFKTSGEADFIATYLEKRLYEIAQFIADESRVKKKQARLNQFEMLDNGYNITCDQRDKMIKDLGLEVKEKV